MFKVFYFHIALKVKSFIILKSCGSQHSHDTGQKHHRQKVINSKAHIFLGILIFNKTDKTTNQTAHESGCENCPCLDST